MTPAPAHPQRRVVRAVRGNGEALQLGDFLAALLVVLIDVPGVPAARLVLAVDPELIAATRQRLAPCGLVYETRDRSVLRELGPQIGVLQAALGHGEPGR